MKFINYFTKGILNKLMILGSLIFLGIGVYYFVLPDLTLAVAMTAVGVLTLIINLFASYKAFKNKVDE